MDGGCLPYVCAPTLPPAPPPAVIIINSGMLPHYVDPLTHLAMYLAAVSSGAMAEWLTWQGQGCCRVAGSAARLPLLLIQLTACFGP